ncbi:MAG: tRNA lysidine(34) synthetase TilS, partial [Owenweeksia sp.]
MNCIQSVSSFFSTLPEGPEQKLLLACSGGVDSVVLLHLLLDLGYKPSVAHCNFNLRGEESDGDLEFVQELAEKHQLPFHAQSFNTKACAKEKRISTQMAARQLRYSFFKELMKKYEYTYLLTAHHQDDSLETLLINLSRGTGFSGLRGIASRENSILRPLHLLTRKDILEYAHANQLEWREDSSNLSDDYQRNFIRHNVIPSLKEAFPHFDRGLHTSLTNLESDHAFFQHTLNREIQRIVNVQPDTQRLLISEIIDQPFQKTILHSWLA